jgi:hypothetical protein
MIKEAIRNYQIKKLVSQFELDSDGSLRTQIIGESFFQVGNGQWGQHTALDVPGEYRNVNPEFGNTLNRVKELKLAQKK